MDDKDLDQGGSSRGEEKSSEESEYYVEDRNKRIVVGSDNECEKMREVKTDSGHFVLYS